MRGDRVDQDAKLNAILGQRKRGEVSVPGWGGDYNCNRATECKLFRQRVGGIYTRGSSWAGMGYVGR